ncbi:MAG: hypothetical protein QM766_14090 [Burkholderiaceae bacterium]
MFSRRALIKTGLGANVVFTADLYPLDGFVGEQDPLAVRVLLPAAGSGDEPRRAALGHGRLAARRGRPADLRRPRRGSGAPGRRPHRDPARARVSLRRTQAQVGSQARPASTPAGPVTAYRYETSAPVSIPLVLMRLGDVALVGMQSELAARLGAQIREGSPWLHTLVVTMMDGEAKYLPDATSYDRHTYEARSASYARGAGEAAVAAVVDQLKQMHASGR